MPIKVKFGDVIEIETRKGLAYAQYTHKHNKPPRYGALIRVLPGFHKTRLESFADIVKQKEQFMVFVPLGAMVNRDIVKVVANEPIPEENREFPLFRAGNADTLGDGKVKVWWLWDGENEWKVGEITPEQRKLPIRSVLNDTMLIKRIEEGWTPENDPR
ncbi:MAG: hypothetical protein ACYC1B_06965 [Thermoleophilia bacterium]